MATSETGLEELMNDPVVYFEVGAADPAPLRPFYAELFGWRFADVAGGGYTLIDTAGGAGINGGLGRSRAGTSWATFYVSVDDPSAVLLRAGSLGGKTVVPVTEVRGTITFAMFDDPDGSLVGLVQRGAEGPAAREPSGGDGACVDWFEVIGSEAARTQAFYNDLFGWRFEGGDSGYGLVVAASAGGRIGGGVGAGTTEGSSTWATFYAHVASVEAAFRKAEQMGGGRVYGPKAVSGLKTGALRDPAGSVIGVYQEDH